MIVSSFYLDTVKYKKTILMSKQHESYSIAVVSLSELHMASIM